MLVDSDVLIWYLRGHAHAAQVITELARLRLSAVSYMELVQGCRNKHEVDLLKQDLAVRDAEIVPLSESVSLRAIALIEAHALVHGLRVADALIAASALQHGLPLLTANVRHFQCIDGLSITRFDP